MTIEIETANRIAQQIWVDRALGRTGGEVMHPDHYEFRQAFRDAVLAAMDEVSKEHNMPLVTDADLPALFRALDPLAERLFIRRHT